MLPISGSLLYQHDRACFVAQRATTCEYPACCEGNWLGGLVNIFNRRALGLKCVAAVALSASTIATASDTVDDIFNYYALPIGLGTSGQPTPEQFSHIQAAGYDVVVNLAMPTSDNALPDEGRLVSENGMTYVHIPVPWDKPDAGHLAQFFGILDAMLAQNKRVWVHCAANYRASAFTYKYLTIRRDLDSSQASTPLLIAWLPQMDQNWRGILDLSPPQVVQP